MQRDRDIASVLVEFTRTLADDHTVDTVLRGLADYCTHLLGVEAVGVLLLDDGALTVATSNSSLGHAVEQLEVELDEGPCSECVRTGTPVHAPDLGATTDRYPHFAPRARELGVAGIHALPLIARSDVVGAVDIMTADGQAVSPEELRAAEMLADVAVSFLVSVRAHERTNVLAGQLQQALDTRVVIEQAKGILAERHGIGLDDAFGRLRAHARSNNAKVRDVAAAICRRELRI